MTEETDYCGFVCSDVVQKAREIKAELDDFYKYNPNEAKQVKLNVLNALGVDVVKLIKDIEEFIPKLEGVTSMDRLLQRATAIVVWESLDLMKTRALTDEELGIKKKPPLWIAPNEVICSYCRGGPIIGVNGNMWRCEQCGKSDYLL